MVVRLECFINTAETRQHRRPAAAGGGKGGHLNAVVLRKSLTELNGVFRTYLDVNHTPPPPTKNPPTLILTA